MVKTMSNNSELKHILVLIPVTEEHKAVLARAAEGCEITYIGSEKVTADDIAKADVIIGNPPAKMINASARLKWLQLFSAGADEYIVPGVLSKNTVLTNASGAYGKSVAEHALALTLMLQKKLYLYRDSQNKAEWINHGPVTSLSDQTVLVVGFGDIGQFYARLVKAMGAYVIGVKRSPGAMPGCADELVTAAELDEVLPRADVVFSVLPGNEETKHIFTAKRFDLMKDSAFFINCGRGNAVAGDVLMKALSEHKIAAAAIDVTEEEPLPEDSPLWAAENLVITPHIAGRFQLKETHDNVVAIAARNLKLFRAGKPLENVVDFATGYRKK